MTKTQNERNTPHNIDHFVSNTDLLNDGGELVMVALLSELDLPCVK